MALLSKSCIYGIRASIYIALEEQDKFTSINKIAKELHLSSHFLTKIMQQLTQFGLMESYRGPNGGVRFSKSVKEIKLVEIIAAIDGLDLFEECALGLEGCGHYDPCPLHDTWTKYRESLKDVFEKESIYTLAENVRNAGLRLRTLTPAELAN